MKPPAGSSMPPPGSGRNFADHHGDGYDDLGSRPPSSGRNFADHHGDGYDDPGYDEPFPRPPSSGRNFADSRGPPPQSNFSHFDDGRGYGDGYDDVGGVPPDAGAAAWQWGELLALRRWGPGPGAWAAKRILWARRGDDTCHELLWEHIGSSGATISASYGHGLRGAPGPRAIIVASTAGTRLPHGSGPAANESRAIGDQPWRRAAAKPTFGADELAVPQSARGVAPSADLANPYDAYYSAGYPAAQNLAGSAHHPGAWVAPPTASAPPSSHLVAPYLGHAPVYTTAAETANLYYGAAATLGAQHMLEIPHVGSPFGAAYPAPVSPFLYAQWAHTTSLAWKRFSTAPSSG
eukprot:CAMPEP_0203886006 /NCGR_PEP_ID=MMETSP0359-20131031/29861_1 /ASSEMBLY_ACC=CAM_ASM_000338 /TAXON_ID=268821 /ORGANISM="Scrippsiella Hangoei, Strain SHTV-5" /LENGTH=349 /DNA_ID=CAMNT_0050806735 /DNA_START=42 /DNA_END=1089 /DNA_ORIENTATION=-